MSGIPDPPKVVIYTEAWSFDTHADEENPQMAMLHCRVTLDGVEVPGLTSATFVATGRDFTTLTLEISPAALEVVSLHHDEFKADVLP